jgi:hypothetical protein
LSMHLSLSNACRLCSVLLSGCLSTCCTTLRTWVVASGSHTLFTVLSFQSYFCICIYRYFCIFARVLGGLRIVGPAIADDPTAPGYLGRHNNITQACLSVVHSQMCLSGVRSALRISMVAINI